MGKEKSVIIRAMFMSEWYGFSKNTICFGSRSQFSVLTGPGHIKIKPGDLNRATGAGGRMHNQITRKHLCKKHGVEAS